MTSFKDFYDETKKVTTNLGNPVSTLSPSSLSSSIQASVTAIGVASAGAFILNGFNSNLEEAENFSREVAQYATSEELISAVSNGVSEPKSNETEEEFVERASNVLRRILKEKFKV